MRRAVTSALYGAAVDTIAQEQGFRYDHDARRCAVPPGTGAAMAYVEGRVIHDADAHLMETPTWLRDHAEEKYRNRLPLLKYASGNELRQTGDPEDQQRDLLSSFDRLRERHGSAEYRATEAQEIMQRKNFAATGGFIAEDRPRALDLLGFSSQLIFNTFHNSRLYSLEHAGDLDLAYAAARAHNRGILEFCSVDRRLLATCYVPLVDPERARGAARDAIDQGAAALLVASGCPPGHSPSHRDLFAVWALAAEADVPVVFHVGGTGQLIDPNYFVNGLPVPHDFHGGDENFRSVDYMGIPAPPAQTLATMIFDGVFEAVPGLRVGVMEQGAIWVPSWLRQMESAFEAFARHEERLQSLSMRPSEYVHRQIRFTPYPTEDVGWIVEQAGDDLVLFSSDYPHVEGGRRPVERFEASLGDASDAVRDRFYAANFAFLMGHSVAELELAGSTT
jgi:predicted TIM-barrel fold metal-dependent hydrolase